jgi:hypothetical protein
MLSSPLSVVLALLFHVLAQPVGGGASGPTLWRFPDENAEALRAAVAAARLPGQLATGAEIEGFLRTVKAPTELGCLADATPCADVDRAMLQTLGVAGRMEATASTGADGATTHVLLLFTPATAGAEERTFRGQGATLAAALTAALADLQGQASLLVDAEPADATLLLDGRPLGSGRGPFFIAPGKHVVAAQKPGHVPGETSIEVEAGGRAEVRFRLPQTETRLRLEFTPPDAKVKLDDHTPFAEAPGIYTITPGKHVLRFEAPRYKAEERVVELEPGTTGELKVELRSLEGSFYSRLKSRHPDVGHHPFYARGGLRTALALAGPVKAGKSSYQTEKTEKSMELAGADVGLGWRGRWLTADLGLGYLGGGDSTKAEVGGGPGYVDALSRIVIRPAIGSHLVFWRFEPYLNLGAAITFESFEADKAIEVASKADPASIDHTFVAFATELGLRFQANESFEAGLGGALEVGPDQRTTLAFLLQAGYCFEIGAP